MARPILVICDTNRYSSVSIDWGEYASSTASTGGMPVGSANVWSGVAGTSGGSWEMQPVSGEATRQLAVWRKLREPWPAVGNTLLGAYATDAPYSKSDQGRASRHAKLTPGEGRAREVEWCHGWVYGKDDDGATHALLAAEVNGIFLVVEETGGWDSRLDPAFVAAGTSDQGFCYFREGLVVFEDDGVSGYAAALNYIDANYP